MISPSIRGFFTNTKALGNRGFTLIEILMVISLISVLAILGVEVMSDTIDEARFQKTVALLQQIKGAMIGDSTLREGGVRTSFGFLGDIGAIPTSSQGISALVSQPTPALPAYAINSTVRIGLGWNGPYLSGGDSGTSYTEDAWGTAITYSPSANPPTLVSLGADRAAGGAGFNQDITITLPTEQRVGTVNGFVCKYGGPLGATDTVDVELNYPNGSGVLTQTLQTIAAGQAGKFSFSSVPFGVRSITAYLPAKVGATQTIGPVVITVDKPNFLVPCNQLETNP